MATPTNEPEEQNVEVTFNDCSPMRVIFDKSLLQQMIDGAQNATPSPEGANFLEFSLVHPTNKLDSRYGWDANDVGALVIFVSPNKK